MSCFCAAVVVWCADVIKNCVLDIYRIIFGLLIILAELRLRYLLVWFSFLLYYIGLGFFYFFVGGLALGDNWSTWPSHTPSLSPMHLLSTAADEHGCVHVLAVCCRYEWVVTIVACCVGCSYCTIACCWADLEKNHQAETQAKVDASQL